MKSPCGVSAVITFFLLAIGHAPSPTAAQFNQRRRGSHRSVRQNCITPENYYGSCVTLSYCPQVANININEELAQRYVFALQRICGSRNIYGDPVVCCTKPGTNPVTERPINPFFPTDSPYRPPPVVHENTYFTTSAPPPVTTAAPVIELRGDVCRGPDTKPGNCVDIKSCTSLLNELRVKQRDESFANFLRASRTVCGNKGFQVCCPNGRTVVATTKARPRLLNVEDVCGITERNYRKIVGGEVSQKGAWPWIALLGYDDPSLSTFRCGGTLITARHVLTAAHCIISNLQFVRLGEHDLSSETETTHIDINVARYVAHPEYNRRNGRSDIAILYLERNVPFSSKVTPICLPKSQPLLSKTYVGYMPFVAGWGKTQEDGESATVLNELQIPVYKNEVCAQSYAAQKRYFSADQFDAAVICAGDIGGGHDTCHGDSGGPLMIREQDKRYYLIGVVSYGIGCAQPKVPGVYTSTQYFMDWITQQVLDTS